MASQAQVIVIGTGEAFTYGLGNTSYILSGSRVPTVLFDCGYQIPERLWAKGLHEKIDAIALTHLHADHAFGLVPLLTRYFEEGRKRELTFFGPPGTQRWLERTLDLGYPGIRKRFLFKMSFVTLQEGEVAAWRGLQFRCARTKHSVLNHTVRVDSVDEAFGAFAISGDGAATPGKRKLVQGVKLLFQECYSLEASTPVHESLAELKKWLPKAGVAEVRLAHLSRNEAQEIKRAARFKIARPGEKIRL